MDNKKAAAQYKADMGQIEADKKAKKDTKQDTKTDTKPTTK